MASAEGTSLVGEPCSGVWGYPPPENFQAFGGSEMLFSALVMRYVSEVSTSSK